MLSNNIFYHSITRKIIVAFGSLFSDIKIRRDKDHVDGVESQTIAVPISYAPKEKWIVRIDQDPELTNNTYITLPRMSFEITGMSFDPSRKINRNSLISCGDVNGVKSTYAPVPWNIDMSMYILAKTQEDCLQIVEQILPFFSPEMTLSVKVVPEQNVMTDVPVILNSVSIQDDYDGDFQTRRFVTYTLTFTLKTNLFGPVSSGKIINRVIVDVNLENTNDTLTYDLVGNQTTGNVTSETWTDKNLQ